jgi:ParB family chromosome partitioning protein
MGKFSLADAGLSDWTIASWLGYRGFGDRPDLITRQVTLAADPPEATSKRSGSIENNATTSAGSPVLRIDARRRRDVTLTPLPCGGASRQEADSALRTVLDIH